MPILKICSLKIKDEATLRRIKFGVEDGAHQLSYFLTCIRSSSVSQKEIVLNLSLDVCHTLVSFQTFFSDDKTLLKGSLYFK